MEELQLMIRYAKIYLSSFEYFQHQKHNEFEKYYATCHCFCMLGAI